MMANFDLIIDSDNLETLFIMESPHTEELEACIPCIGSTGRRMALHLINDDSLPFGILLKNRDYRVIKYGIMNTFNFPLGKKTDLNSSQKHVADLKNIKWIKGKTDRESHYEKHLKLIRDITDIEQLSDFKTRLINYVSQSPKLRNIVICGYIAQSMYLYSFNQKIPRYNVPMSIKTKRKIKLLFINHPSEKNEIWDFDPIKIED